MFEKQARVWYKLFFILNSMMDFLGETTGLSISTSNCLLFFVILKICQKFLLCFFLIFEASRLLKIC